MYVYKNKHTFCIGIDHVICKDINNTLDDIDRVFVGVSAPMILWYQNTIKSHCQLSLDSDTIHTLSGG